jgi:hypothetical protein
VLCVISLLSPLCTEDKVEIGGSARIVVVFVDGLLLLLLFTYSTNTNETRHS